MVIFQATIDIIVGNPFVLLPEEVLAGLLAQAGQHKGKVPIKGTINGKPYRQTLVKYAGAWRLYINMVMLKDSPRRVGEKVEVSIEYDPEDRSIPIHQKLQTALDENPVAKAKFESLSPSRQLEIVRYIAHLKSEESVERNVARAIGFLKGEERFVGREKP
ncbi:MAG: YdeI/OmpD-associated family protein [Saprospiraceae bacterium]|nr:YdeI/OmpD-associated family protein [Saprospiraceae bacterium]